MGWNVTVPTSASLIVNIPTIFSDNQKEIDYIWGVEHYNLSHTLSGRHQPGLCSIMDINATTAIAAITGVTGGAIAMDTTLGLLKRYNGTLSAWSQVNLDNHPILDVSIGAAGTNTFASSASVTHPLLINFNMEAKDILSGYGNGVYTTVASGFLFITSSVKLSAAVRDVEYALALRHIGSGTGSATLDTTIHREISPSSDGITLTVSTDTSAACGDRFYATLSHTASTTVSALSGTANSFLKIYRTS